MSPIAIYKEAKRMAKQKSDSIKGKRRRKRMPPKPVCVDTYMRRIKCLVVYFDKNISKEIVEKTYSTIKANYPEVSGWDRSPILKNAFVVNFKNAGAAMDFYKNWKRVIGEEVV